MKSKILIVYTGGTIGMIKDYQTGALRPFDFSKILERIPELNQLSCDINTISFDTVIDSSDVGVEDLVTISSIVFEQYDDYDGFVILTGSDTMSYIASALSFMLENLAKPVIFTGSQLPIGDLRTDAKENLITAIEIASAQENGEPVVQEVCLYFEYKLYRGNRTSKISAEHFEGFSSANYPPLAESGVHITFQKPLLFRPDRSKRLILRKNLCAEIGVLRLFPGMTEGYVEHFLSYPNFKAVILETFGAGNAPSSVWFLNALKEARQRGVELINITQCNAGSVIQGQYETSLGLKSLGVINGGDMTIEAAVAKSMYLLGARDEVDDFQLLFEQSLRGEKS